MSSWYRKFVEANAANPSAGSGSWERRAAVLLNSTGGSGSWPRRACGVVVSPGTQGSWTRRMVLPDAPHAGSWPRALVLHGGRDPIGS